MRLFSSSAPVAFFLPCGYSRHLPRKHDICLFPPSLSLSAQQPTQKICGRIRTKNLDQQTDPRLLFHSSSPVEKSSVKLKNYSKRDTVSASFVIDWGHLFGYWSRCDMDVPEQEDGVVVVDVSVRCFVMVSKDAKWASTSSKIWSTRSTSPRRRLCTARSCSRAARSSRLNEAVIDVSDKKEKGLGVGGVVRDPP